jgi:hypothetical protein
VSPDVQCYAGASYPEKPRSFDWKGKSYQVTEILDQFREPDRVGFLVQCTPGKTFFHLLYKIRQEEWLIQPKSSVMISDEPHQD